MFRLRAQRFDRQANFVACILGPSVFRAALSEPVIWISASRQARSHMSALCRLRAFGWVVDSEGAMREKFRRREHANRHGKKADMPSAADITRMWELGKFLHSLASIVTQHTSFQHDNGLCSTKTITKERFKLQHS